MVQRARHFRQTLNAAEARLWSRLKKLRVLGFHLRRQAPFRGYYLDFVCFSRRLVIEVDGACHGVDEQIEHDQVRDRVLAREGFLTLRFQNRLVLADVDRVMEIVLQALEREDPTRLAFGDPPSP